MFTRNSPAKPKPFEPRTARYNGAQPSISAPSSGEKPVIGNDLKKPAKRIWLVGPDAKQVEAKHEEQQRREIRKARWLGCAVGLAAAVVVLFAISAFQHR